MSPEEPVPVFLASAPWCFALPQRARFLCEAVQAAGSPCLHVDPPTRRVRMPRLASRGRGQQHVLRPALPAWRSWWSLEESELRKRAWRGGRVLQQTLTTRHALESLVAVVETPQWLPWLDGLGIERVVYDRIDELPAHAPRPGLEERLAPWEEELIDRCGAAIVTGDELAKPMLSRRPDLEIRRIPNGVDAIEFDQRARERDPLPQLADLPRPLVGFVGALFRWVDYELIDAVSRLLEDVSFALIGPIEGSRPAPVMRPNVHFLGPVSRDGVPACIASFDAAWIPFRDDAVGRAANPLKLYEYLALGKPVVTTPVANLQELGGLVASGSGSEEIAHLLRLALADPERDAEPRRALARSCSWASRADGLLGFLGELYRGALWRGRCGQCP